MNDNYEIRDKNGMVADMNPTDLTELELVYTYHTRSYLDDKITKEAFNKEVRKLRREMKRMLEGRYTFIRGGKR